MGILIRKHWDLLTFTQKRHRLYKVTQNKEIFFWGVCGKDRQRYYNSIDINEDNIDTIRDTMYEEYMTAINNGRFFNKEEKIERVSMLLGKGDYE